MDASVCLALIGTVDPSKTDLTPLEMLHEQYMKCTAK